MRKPKVMLKSTLKHVHLEFFHQAMYPHQLWFGLLLNPVAALEQTTNSSKPRSDTPWKGPQTCPLCSPASLRPSQCPSAQCRELGMQKKTPAELWYSPKLMAVLLLRIQILL